MSDHERKLEQEMLEAAEAVADAINVEKDPLLIILWRLNHQDRLLDSINGDMKRVSATLSDHIAREGEIKDSIDELVHFWQGSKLVGRVASWFLGGLAAIMAAYASAKKGLFS